MKRHNILSGITIMVFILFSSCVTPALDIVKITDGSNDYNTLVLDSIVLDSIYTYTESMEELRSVIISAATRNMFTIVGDKASVTYPRISFHLREQGYVKGFRNFTSLSVMVDISNSDHATLYKIAYFEDGDESFDSLQHIRNIINLVFEEFRREISKNRGKTG